MGGLVELVLGDTYGHPKLNDVRQDPALRYCYKNNYYPGDDDLTLLVTDVNGLLILLFF